MMRDRFPDPCAERGCHDTVATGSDRCVFHHYQQQRVSPFVARARAGLLPVKETRP